MNRILFSLSILALPLCAQMSSQTYILSGCMTSTIGLSESSSYSNGGSFGIYHSDTGILASNNYRLVQYNSTAYGLDVNGEYYNGIVPSMYNLHQNYPNPFNPATIIKYSLPEHNHVNITLYDLLGRQVKILVSESQDAGIKSVQWDATDDQGLPVSAGVYFYQIKAGEFVQTRKMVVLK